MGDHHRAENETFKCVWRQLSEPVNWLHYISNNFGHSADGSTMLPSIIHHVYVCCVFVCLAKSSLEIQQKWAAQYRCSCVWLVSWAHIAVPSPLCFCCVYGYQLTHASVCVCRREWVWRMPALPRPAHPLTATAMWHKETTEHERERACLCWRVCTLS